MRKISKMETKYLYLGQRLLFGRNNEPVIIVDFVGEASGSHRSIDKTTSVEVMRIKPLRKANRDLRRKIWAPLAMLKPLGYCLIKPSAGGKFRYHTVAWNNEKLQTSEPIDDKKHIVKMAKFYYPDFVIVDKTK